jgi:hypothetical protein
MAQCLGHRYGTGCYHRSRTTRNRENWKNWQLCHKCARIIHPEYYANKKYEEIHSSEEIFETACLFINQNKSLFDRLK